jgi:hypothetical protein
MSLLGYVLMTGASLPDARWRNKDTLPFPQFLQENALAVAELQSVSVCEGLGRYLDEGRVLRLVKA